MEPEASAPSARLGARAGRSPRDVVLSLAILLVPIALLLTFYRVVLDGDEPVTVDPNPAILEARTAGAFPVLASAGLGEGWHVTTAHFRRAAEGATLRIGYVAPDDDAALVVQSSIPADTLLPAELGKDPEPAGMFRADNGAWRQYRTGRGETALVLAEPRRTVVVVGTTGDQHLQELTASLGS